MWIRSCVRNLRLYSGKAEQFEVKKIHKPQGTFGPLTAVSQEDRHFQVSAGGEREEGTKTPLVIIFGGAGATHKVSLPSPHLPSVLECVLEPEQVQPGVPRAGLRHPAVHPAHQVHLPAHRPGPPGPGGRGQIPEGERTEPAHCRPLPVRHGLYVLPGSQHRNLLPGLSSHTTRGCLGQLSGAQTCGHHP